eukprot:jgi/Botrbrau1/7913/Bobra.9_2s0081.1
MSRYSDVTSGEANRTPEELSKHFTHHNQQYHDTPKGYRHEPHNAKEMHHEQMINEKNPEGGHYKERASDSRRTGGKYVPEDHQPQNINRPHGHYVYDEVTEGRLGGGEDILYDGRDGPIGSSDPKPKGQHAE